MDTSSFRASYMRLRYRWSFQQFLAELLQKRWMEPVVPFTAAILVILAFSLLIPDYFSLSNVASTGRQFGEFGFVAMAMAIVIISGGIDLSVGSMFAVANFVALMMFNMFGFSAPVVYEMLNIQEWANAKGTTQYLTFECESDEAVTEATNRAIANGARLLHDPYETYYGAFQSVMADPDGNVFRINHFRPAP